MWSAPKRITILFIVGLLGLLILAPLAAADPLPEKGYSQFLADVADGRVQGATISGGTLTADYRDDVRYKVTMPGDGAGALSVLTANNVEVTYAHQSQVGWLPLLLSVALPIAVVAGIVWLMNGQQNSGGAGQVFSFGQSRARLYAPGEKIVTMRDVAGIPEAKEELWEVVDFLRSPDRYRELGARIPKGVMLYGPPGTGKTLLARAVAGEAGVPFFSISGSDFVEIFAGVGASRVRDLFVKARKHAPCIIFVDEIDAVGRQRGVSMSGGSDEREQTLNQLLVEMDGFDTAEHIIVMAATNRLDILDGALLRPGRFDRQISVDPPDRIGRKEILQVHAHGKPLADDVDLDRVAGMTTGFTGADLANLLNEAALLAARRRHPAIGMEEIRQAYERVVTGGLAQRKTLAADEKVRIAYHEAGHAVVSRQLTHVDPIEKVTIVPRGRALGYVMYQPQEDKNLHSRTEIMDRIVSLLGGRAAEQVLLGEVSTGAADDLERATGLARRMVTDLGMSPELGPVKLKVDPMPVFGAMSTPPISDRTAVVIDEVVRQLVTDAYDRALALVREKRPELERVANALLEKESLDGREVENLLAM
ncbi:MAG: ATP-dependent metalloprotease FtsH [Symbiobacteriaceae bacterium]|jgi:cell division protease FtsH|nr:ATP-dependent metalloprotease FtsH [Symbiobacteriaceae bacterium]